MSSAAELPWRSPEGLLGTLRSRSDNYGLLLAGLEQLGGWPQPGAGPRPDPAGEQNPCDGRLCADPRNRPSASSRSHIPAAPIVSPPSRGDRSGSPTSNRAPVPVLRIEVETAHWFATLTPPNRACGFPTQGSPVNGWLPVGDSASPPKPVPSRTTRAPQNRGCGPSVVISSATAALPFATSAQDRRRSHSHPLVHLGVFARLRMLEVIEPAPKLRVGHRDDRRLAFAVGPAGRPH